MSVLASADSPVALSPPDLAAQDANIAETGKSPETVESFIDKGNMKLPVAPEIAEKGSTKIPSQILDNPVIELNVIIRFDEISAVILVSINFNKINDRL